MNKFKKISIIISVFSIIGITYASLSLGFPLLSYPTGKTTGGKLNNVIDNISQDCGAGKYLQGFTSTGKLVCKNIISLSVGTPIPQSKYTVSGSGKYAKYLQNILNDCGDGKYVKGFNSDKKMVCSDKNENLATIGLDLEPFPVSAVVGIIYPDAPGNVTYSNFFTTVISQDCGVDKAMRGFTDTGGMICENVPKNAVCGSADGDSLTAKPTTGLCTVASDTTPTVSGTGPWTWTCAGINGGTNASCSAQKACTYAETLTNGYYVVNASVSGCSQGCATPGLPDANNKCILKVGSTYIAPGATDVQKQNTPCGGSASPCSTTILTNNTNVMGYCGNATWGGKDWYFPTYPTNTVNNTTKILSEHTGNYWTRHCENCDQTTSIKWRINDSSGAPQGRSNQHYVRCESATVGPTNAVCGSADGDNLTTKPTTNLCSVALDITPTVNGTGPWTWTCAGKNGGTNASCSANKKQNGVCGTANGTVGYTAPFGTELCANGTAGVVTDNGVNWSWNCMGILGGTTSNCTKNIQCQVKRLLTTSDWPYVQWNNTMYRGRMEIYTTSTPGIVNINEVGEFNCPPSPRHCDSTQSSDISAPYKGRTPAVSPFDYINITGHTCSGNNCTLNYSAISSVNSVEASDFTPARQANYIYSCTRSPTNGQCGPADGTITNYKPKTSLCNIGTPSLITVSGTSFNWQCLGDGSNANCSARSSVSCGSANGENFAVVPSTNLCSVGTASARTGTGPWNWTCTLNNVSVSCSANKKQNAVCGSADGDNLTTIPTTNLCTVGSDTTPTVSGSGPWTWTCAGINGGTNASCNANKKQNGVCGSADDDNLTSIPTTNLCSVASDTTPTVSGTGPWTWTCAGINGGTNASCNANKKQNGVCGSANGDNLASYPTTGNCTVGTKVNVDMVGTDGTYNWRCDGLNAGTNVSCSANKISGCGGTVSAGGFTYTTKLGPDGKCWTSTNMKHLPITGGSDCYNNQQTCGTSGRLYSWYAAMGLTRGSTSTIETTNSICKQLGIGWALPTDAQWTALVNAGATGWSGNKLSGIISSLPGVYRYYDDYFSMSGINGVRLSATQSSGTYSWSRSLSSANSTVTRGSGFDKDDGYSVVCIKN